MTVRLLLAAKRCPAGPGRARPRQLQAEPGSTGLQRPALSICWTAGVLALKSARQTHTSVCVPGRANKPCYYSMPYNFH
jgi:hypothetical protein